MSNRMGQQESLQISKMGTIDISTQDFVSPGFGVCIKNDGDEPVELQVNLWDMPDDEFITTYFDVGWNPEIVRTIKQGTGVYDLKWGA